MCGICGIVNATGREIDRPCLEMMNAAITHRGPDSDGYFVEAGVGLGVRRLAIIDLATGDQPIANEDSSVWVVMNGEIFNFPELREELERRGHRFSTKTDTETLVHLYEEHGRGLVEHLRGQFAFALWDRNLQRLLVARDRLGQKPLYYTVRDGRLYFSSELPSLLTGLDSRPDLDRGAIDLYLSLQYIPEPRTPFHGIHKLPAAHTLVWQNGQLTTERYWDFSYEPKWDMLEEEAIGELRYWMDEAVRIRMISDVPLGAHLSGGIDSSIVVALMARHSTQPVKTFSVGFEEDHFSELRYARAIVERYQTDHHEFNLRFGELPELIDSVVGYVGEPFADPSALPLYQLSMLTREHVTVALNGDGGDEAFAGYQRYWLDRWANRYALLPDWVTQQLVPGLVGWLPDGGDKPVGGSLVNGLKRLRQVSSIDRRASILRWGSYFSPEHKARLWKAPLEDTSESILINEFENAQAQSYLDRTLWTDIHTYLPGDLLIKADRMTMAASLEGRSPFLDHHLVEWAARLPEKFRLRGRTGKYLLRKAFEKELPAKVRGRGKQGFGIPLGKWFRGPLADWAEGLLLSGDGLVTDWFEREAVKHLLEEHARGTRDHGKRIYALVNLTIWERKFGSK